MTILFYCMNTLWEWSIPAVLLFLWSLGGRSRQVLASLEVLVDQLALLVLLPQVDQLFVLLK